MGTHSLFFFFLKYTNGHFIHQSPWYSCVLQLKATGLLFGSEISPLIQETSSGISTGSRGSLTGVTGTLRVVLCESPDTPHPTSHHVTQWGYLYQCSHAGGFASCSIWCKCLWCREGMQRWSSPMSLLSAAGSLGLTWCAFWTRWWCSCSGCAQ